jgi:pimeloyl-ACP methyl ester carboxylesterase
MPAERLYRGMLMGGNRLALRGLRPLIPAVARTLLGGGILADLPTRLDRIDCPVVLAQGTAGVVAVGQTPLYLAAIPGARFVPLLGAGYAPQSDTPDAILQLVHEVTGVAADRPRALAVLQPTA